MSFLSLVLNLIDEKKITKNKLLTDLGINKNAFVDWDQRGNIPSGDVVAKIADYFGVTTDYLLGRANDSGPGAGSSEEAAMDGEFVPTLKDWEKAFSELSNEELLQVQDLIRKEFSHRLK